MLTVTKQVSIEEFGFPVKGKFITGLDDSFNPAIPSKIEYTFPKNTTRALLSFIEFPEESNFWLWGLHGTGKTSLVQQVCARLDWGCYSINGSETLEIEDLLYRVQLKNGDTSTELEALTKAYTYGGVFLFNEIDLVDPAKLAALNEILSGDTLIIPGIDTVLKKHENFRFIAAANTNGSFDEDTGIDFAGTGTMNTAFMDRFIVMKAEYLDQDTEISMLMKYSEELYQRVWKKHDPKIALRLMPIITNMVVVANESRKAAMNSGDFDKPISYRGLKRWVQKAIQYQGAPSLIKLSFQEAVTNALSKSHRESVNRFCADVFGSDF